MTAVQLSRILSALRYNSIISTKIIDDYDFFQNIYLGLFYTRAALIYEGIKTFKKLKLELENLESYKNNSDEIDKILMDLDDDNSFLKGVLARVRDKITFHYDKKVIEEIIGIYVDDSIEKDRDIVFFETKTKKIEDTDYVLAGDMNINYIFKFVQNETLDGENKFEYLFGKLGELSDSFGKIIENMMLELIEDMCKVEED